MATNTQVYFQYAARKYDRQKYVMHSGYGLTSVMVSNGTTFVHNFTVPYAQTKTTQIP
jgi:hypothetical protein